MIKIVFLCFILFLKSVYSTEIYFSPSNNCQDLIISNISKANDSLYIMIYSITDNNIVEAIKDAYNRGIDVKVIADKRQSKGKNSLVYLLQEYKIPVIFNRRKIRTEHNKVSIIDKYKVITGSYNYTNNAKFNNSENCILIDDYNKKFYQRFQQLWSYYNE